ncbi:MAG: cation:proton antiporter [archaeon]
MAESTLLPIILGMVIVVLGLAMTLRFFKQPYIIAYILAGIVAGPAVLKLVTDVQSLNEAGNIGIIILLFFLGMEVSLPQLIAKWRVSILGTIAQIVISVLVMLGLGHFLGWDVARSVLFGFVITISSTAVILKILEERNELKTRIGQNVLSIALVQDIALVPMLLLLTFLGKGVLNPEDVLLPIIGSALIVGLLILIHRRQGWHVPFAKFIRGDHDLQVFMSIILCLGIAAISAFFGLSTAFGAFIAGIIVGTAKETGWVRTALHPFRVILVALFFMYVGMLIDVHFFFINLGTVLLLVLFVFVLNTFINAIVLYFLGDTLGESIYAGSLLAQIGEFSFLLASIGLVSGFISSFDYQLIVSVIALTLLCSPFWILLVRRVLLFLPSSLRETKLNK